MAPDLRRYILMGVSALVGLGGLGMAASAGIGTSYHLGIAIFIAAVLGVFYLIRRQIDAQVHGEETTTEAAPRIDTRRLVPQSPLGPWLALAAAAFVAIGGLASASGGRPGSSSYDFGLVLFILAIAYIFVVIRHLADPSDQ